VVPRRIRRTSRIFDQLRNRVSCSLRPGARPLAGTDDGEARDAPRLLRARRPRYGVTALFALRFVAPPRFRNTYSFRRMESSAHVARPPSETRSLACRKETRIRFGRR
jgi:hypothetical protein